ncbi:hypothetical protein ABK040_016280 [Willaertia magna]
MNNNYREEILNNFEEEDNDIGISKNTLVFSSSPNFEEEESIDKAIQDEGLLSNNNNEDNKEITINEITTNNITEEVLMHEEALPTKFSERMKYHLNHSKAELLQVFRLSWPTVVINVSYMLLTLVSLTFVGHLKSDTITSDTYISSASLANSLFFIFGFIPVGLIHGQDTLTSQSYGAKNFRRMGIILNRSLVCIMICLIPIFFLLWFTNYILIVIGQHQDLVDLATLFARILAPGVIPFAICESISLYLVTQDILMVNVIIWVASVILNIGLNFLFEYGFHLGFIGPAIAITTSRYVMLFVYIIVIWAKGYMKEDWEGFIDFKEVFRWSGFWELLKLGIPGSVTLTAEVAGFELSTIISSYLSLIALSAHSIVLNIVALCFMIPLSVATAASIRVGQCLGSLSPRQAKYAAYSSIAFSSLFMLLCGSFVAILRNYIPKIYTEDQNVIDAAATVFPICFLFQMFDGLQAVSSAILRGVGKQTITAISNLAAYYVFGLPVGALLAFLAGWDLVGIWLGLSVGVIVVGILMFSYIVFRIDWEKESKLANERATEEDKPQLEEELQSVVVNGDEEKTSINSLNEEEILDGENKIEEEKQ